MMIFLHFNYYLHKGVSFDVIEQNFVFIFITYNPPVIRVYVTGFLLNGCTDFDEILTLKMFNTGL